MDVTLFLLVLFVSCSAYSGDVEEATTTEITIQDQPEATRGWIIVPKIKDQKDLFKRRNEFNYQLKSFNRDKSKKWKATAHWRTPEEHFEDGHGKILEQDSSGKIHEVELDSSSIETHTNSSLLFVKTVREKCDGKSTLNVDCPIPDKPDTYRIVFV